MQRHQQQQQLPMPPQLLPSSSPSISVQPEYQEIITTTTNSYNYPRYSIENTRNSFEQNIGSSSPQTYPDQIISKTNNTTLKRWSHVRPPTSNTNLYHVTPQLIDYTTKDIIPLHVSQAQYQQQQQQLFDNNPDPGLRSLRVEAPFNQELAPVYTSQPATQVFQGGAYMRGDLKWPPVEYKTQADADNEARRMIALGPVCRPRRANKDYSEFFAKNALQDRYPRYRIPPGTQHITHQLIN